jgi:hypothetical protein
VSTDLVFGRLPAAARRIPASIHTVAPISRYGASKADGERAVLDGRSQRPLVVRLPLLYGDSFGRGLGASDSLFAAIARGERPILFTDELRTPLDAAEAARALIDLALSDRRGIAHVAGARKLSRYEFGLELLRAGGLSEPDARSRIRSARRCEVAMDATRPADVALGSTERPNRGARVASRSFDRERARPAARAASPAQLTQTNPSTALGRSIQITLHRHLERVAQVRRLRRGRVAVPALDVDLVAGVERIAERAGFAVWNAFQSSTTSRRTRWPCRPRGRDPCVCVGDLTHRKLLLPGSTTQA